MSEQHATRTSTQSPDRDPNRAHDRMAVTLTSAGLMPMQFNMPRIILTTANTGQISASHSTTYNAAYGTSAISAMPIPVAMSCTHCLLEACSGTDSVLKP
mmetsp:Transcript_1279/g.3602  ORF Transcript_1279/g.3602 Transcript_1279/m.3602 type:complete len:100 (-) Transcript_1279:726-1025(-)